ncbi:MAG: hypothetical protein QXZ20_01885 [Candidatus Aenigmatarchaeota archaeon]
MKEGKKNFRVLKREVLIFLFFLGISLLLNLIYSIIQKNKIGPALHFWEDHYFYQIWKNSLRENAELLLVFGYPIFLIARFTYWRTKKIKILYKKPAPLENKYSEEEVKEILGKLVQEIKLNKKIISVQYRSRNLWYLVRFDKLPNTIIPQNFIIDYIKNKSEKAKKEIIKYLLS